jgi:hypothetical protein
MAKIIEFPVESSNHVARLQYDPDSRHFHIAFKTGDTEIYAGVPPDVFAEMTRSPSIGTYYHRVIKRHYRRVEHTHGKANV